MLKHSLLAATVSAVGVTQPLQHQQFDSFPAPLAAHLVNIGGDRKLNINCFGTGTPTVIFEAGGGDDLLVWRKVIGPTARVTRACVYDRAGFGASPPSGRQMDGEHVVEDLQALIEHVPLPTPVVLVGHSIGGTYALLFADHHRSELVGLVLIDPTTVLDDKQDNSEANKKLRKQQFDAIIAERNRCRALAAAGKLTADTPTECFQVPKNLAPDEARYFLEEQTRPAYWEAVASEITSTVKDHEQSTTLTQEHDASTSLGSLPLIALRSRSPLPLEFMARSAEIEEERTKAEVAQVSRSTRGLSLIVQNSGHYIHLDRPEAVVAAILYVIDQARNDLAASNASTVGGLSKEAN